MATRPGPCKGKPERYTGSGYSVELCEAVCGWIAEGYSLNRACEMWGDGLYSELVHHWRKAHPEFQSRYDDARMSQLESWADEIVDIADGLRRTEIQREEMAADAGGKVGKAKRIASFGKKMDEVEEKGNGKKGKSNYDYHAVKRDFLRIDSRKWLLSKLNPSKWGDRVQTQVTGPEGGALMVQVVRFGDLPVGEQVELKGAIVGVDKPSLPEPVVEVESTKEAWQGRRGRGRPKLNG